MIRINILFRKQYRAKWKRQRGIWINGVLPVKVKAPAAWPRRCESDTSNSPVAFWPVALPPPLFPPFFLLFCYFALSKLSEGDKAGAISRLPSNVAPSVPSRTSRRGKMYLRIMFSHACSVLDSGPAAQRYAEIKRPLSLAFRLIKFKWDWQDLRWRHQPVRRWCPFFFFSFLEQAWKGHFNLKTGVFQRLTYILNLQLLLTFQLTLCISTSFGA